MTVRSYNCLKREGIHTVGELITRSEADLLDIRNFGTKSIDEVKVKLTSLGLGLKDSPPGFDPGAAVYYEDDDYDDEDFEPLAVAEVAQPVFVVEEIVEDDSAFAEDERL